MSVEDDKDVPITMSELERWMALERRATQGKWEWWTGCSWNRLGVKDASNSAHRHVLRPYIAPDGHPDCAVNNADMELIVEMRSAFPRLLRELAQRIPSQPSWDEKSKSGTRCTGFSGACKDAPIHAYFRSGRWLTCCGDTCLPSCIPIHEVPYALQMEREAALRGEK